MAKPENTAVVRTRAIGKIVSSDDVDIASRAIEGTQTTELHIDHATSARLLKSIDRQMMPILYSVYDQNFLDKTALTYASVMDLTASHVDGGIELHGGQESWLARVFFFGYLSEAWPTTRLLQYLPLAKYLTFNIIVWGAVLCCFPNATNFAGAMVLRFSLGLLESSITSGFALISDHMPVVHGVRTRTGPTALHSTDQRQPTGYRNPLLEETPGDPTLRDI
ncbi:hypothetical protein BGZ61DRAFT_487503 [Ilyonectria robusta]|uniref:uncharacterized protein n=1 Tax=Ilyonectria robusta TaxID=1079257 RepID=UPI001E8DF4BB|nr:uncharacterized protein BGZ61DRAFT_487503 [Ilyonectria robusta]KAH8652590.1 hypothetical protein BGZ61DRAFT_487503 [Ilyonectria robusta]